MTSSRGPDTRDGGERRDSPSDDQKSGGGALRDAQARAHLTGRPGEARPAATEIHRPLAGGLTQARECLAGVRHEGNMP